VALGETGGGGGWGMRRTTSLAAVAPGVAETVRREWRQAALLSVMDPRRRTRKLKRLLRWSAALEAALARRDQGSAEGESLPPACNCRPNSRSDHV